MPCRCPRRRTVFDNLNHSYSQIIRIPHRQPPQPEKAIESYSRLIVNPFDSQKVETALEMERHDYLVSSAKAPFQSSGGGFF
jgi:hypothetical protein